MEASNYLWCATCGCTGVAAVSPWCECGPRDFHYYAWHLVLEAFQRAGLPEPSYPEKPRPGKKYRLGVEIPEAVLAAVQARVSGSDLPADAPRASGTFKPECGTIEMFVRVA